MTRATRGIEAAGIDGPHRSGGAAWIPGDRPVTVSLIGSTGSIGTQAIEVMEACPERFDVVALGAHRSVDQLVAQAGRLHPTVVAIGDPALAPDLAERLAPGRRGGGGHRGPGRTSPRWPTWWSTGWSASPGSR